MQQFISHSSLKRNPPFAAVESFSGLQMSIFMSETIYRIFTRVEKRAEGYTAVAVAIPGNQPLRCAPASREARCCGPREAERTARAIARQLADELDHRGLPWMDGART
jgi:hypothetical protein